MKFKVDREKFQKAMQRLNPLVASHPIMPIIGNVLIESQEGTVKLTATNLDITIVCTIPASIEEIGAITLPCKVLTLIASCSSGQEVSFETDENAHCKVACGTAHFMLLGLPADDFPAPESFTPSRTIKLKSKEFKHLINNVYYAVGTDDSRKVLTGVLVSVKNSQLALVTTDGRRMATVEKTPDACEGADGDAIVPGKTMNEIKRLLDSDGDVSMEFSDKLCAMKTEDTVLTSKLIEGNYPNFRAVIPTSFAQSIEMPVSLLQAKIATVSHVLSESSNYVVMNLENNKLSLFCSSAERGEANDEMDLEYTGENFKISFNPAFLLDPLRNTVAEKLKMRFNDSMTPVAIETEDGFLYILMPCKPR